MVSFTPVFLVFFIGYGFSSFLSFHKIITQIRESRYNFVHIACQYKKPLSQVLEVLVEPFASFTFRPKEGVGNDKKPF